MIKRLGYVALAVAALSIAGTQAWAQADDKADVDPDAVAALTRMGSYLRTLKSFQVDATTTRDDVLDNGQVIQYSAKVNVLARLPDRMRVEIHSDEKDRLYLFDGKNFTIFAERANFYAVVPAPPTLAKLSDDLNDKYDIQLPLEDLFFWGTERETGRELTGAYDVGPSEIGGVSCEHYAFRQKGLDWQVWVQLGDFPLPRKLVLSTLTDDARPQYSSTLNWNLAPSFDESAFVFDPPKDAQKIAVAKVEVPAEAKK
jgi:hypothetical protein